MPLINVNTSKAKKYHETKKRPTNSTNVQMSQTIKVDWQVDIFTFRHLIEPKVGGRGWLKIFLQALSLRFRSLVLPFCFSPLFFFALPQLPRAWNRLVWIRLKWNFLLWGTLKVCVFSGSTHFSWQAYFSFERAGRDESAVRQPVASGMTCWASIFLS